MCFSLRSLIFAAALVSLGTINLSAQFEPSTSKTTVPAAKPDPAPAPTAAPDPAPTAAPAPAEANASMTEEKVKEMVNEAIKDIRLVDNGARNTAEKAQKTANEAMEAVNDISGTVRIVRYFFFVLVFAVIGYGLWWLYKRFGKKSKAVTTTATHAVLLLFAIVATATHAAAQVNCYNVLTGKTPGSVKQAIGIVGMNNEFVCAGNGAVEITKLDGTVLLTPTVIKTSPLTFTFTPTAAARAIIKVAGKSVSALAIVADPDQAFLVGSAIDLAPAKPDTAARAAAQKAITEIKNVNGRLVEVESRVSKLESTDKILVDANNSLEARVRAFEAKPAFDDSALRTELSRTNEAIRRLNDKVNAMGADLSATDKVANEAHVIAVNAQDQVTRLRWVTAKSGTKGERKLLRDPALKK